jgi:hypothetical protein
MMEDAMSFGGNILCPEFETKFPEQIGLAEMIILLLPFRWEKELRPYKG